MSALVFMKMQRVLYWGFCMGKITDGGRERRSVYTQECHVTCVKYIQVYLLFSCINASCVKSLPVHFGRLYLILDLLSCVAENSHLHVWALAFYHFYWHFKAFYIFSWL